VRLIALCFLLTGALAAQTRELTVITVSGSGYQRGFQHGKLLRQPIQRLVGDWKQGIREKCKQDSDAFIREFLKRFDFVPAVRQWTPDLLEEVRGIADGSGLAFGDVFALQLFNDEFWLNAPAICGDRCSALALRGASSTFVAQNMDLRGVLDGTQVVLRSRDESGFETLLLTHAGLIGLTGVNQAGVGVVVNALTQLRWAGRGLPVAFVIRGLLEQKSWRDATAFLRRVSHAAGQNYIVGTPESAGSFEASVGGVAEYVPRDGLPVILHTNHPLASTDFRPGYDRAAKETNSFERLASLSARLSKPPSENVVAHVKQALRARDSPVHPVCRRFESRDNSFTFGSVIFELSARPRAWITAGPPDESEYREFELRPAGQRQVFAPVFVGRPPSDAYIGLARLPDGEIRHYNYGEWPDSEDPLYIASRDNGFTWERKLLPKGTIAADQGSPISGEYIRLFHRREGVFVARSKGGIDGEWVVRKVWGESGGMLKPPVFIRGGRRVLVGCQFPREDGAQGLRSGTFYSDDDGLTWKLSSLVSAPLHTPGGIHRSARWQNGGCEPAVVELKDGRIWMLMRTSQDNLYESFSHDGGETWEPARPSRFYSTLTMPTLGRLRDGRILLLWNNTTPLPEVARDESHLFFVGSGVLDGTWEDVFTNRDAIHAAVSADEGKTWQGFRELYLNPRRNDGNYAETGGTDRSVHQSQFVELDDGSVLVSLGQHPLHRALVKFHPDWLLEKKRASSFQNALEDWSVHMYVAGIRGHCAFNRRAGADLVEHPNRPSQKALRIRRLGGARPRQFALVSENQGAVWNFPAGSAGTLTVRVMFRQSGRGGRISLLDRWVNPTDPVAGIHSMFTVSDADLDLTPGRWHEIRFAWDGLNDQTTDRCRLYVDGVLQDAHLPLNRPSANGISYVHFQSAAVAEDTAGFLVESVAAEVR
jgi:hypothetical protein